MDLRIPAPRPRVPFKDFVVAVRHEHEHCASHDNNGPLKAWHEHVGKTIRWVLRCDACGGWSINLSASDVASLTSNK
jgi:hypothetical protein